ncbi:sugar kinase [Streptomyces sp. TR06-5]|uniref:sugar kinase n=1 Tax=unclassified Streptomyces TaxID=2593676 RepID=UPI0039A10603
MATGPEAVTCGEAMLLMLAETGVPLDRAVDFRRSVTGAEPVVAAGLARLGHRTRWLGRLGADAVGEAVLRELRADGVDVSWTSFDPDAPTGLVLRDSRPEDVADAQYYGAGSAGSRLAAHDLPPEALAGTRLVHVSGITPMLSPLAAQAVHRLVMLARQSGAAFSFAPTVRGRLGTDHEWMRVVGPLMREADLVVASEDELELLLGGGGEQAAKALLELGRAHLVVVTRPDGSAVAVGREGRWVHEPVAGRTGPAGEAFTAGWLSAWLRNVEPERALAEAACVAALAAEAPGDTTGLPTAAGRDRAVARLR